MVPDGKDHEVVIWILDGIEEWINGVLQAKVLRDIPGVVPTLGTVKNNCGSTRFLPVQCRDQGETHPGCQVA